MRRTLIAIVVVAAIGGPGQAQSPPAQPATFEVASIRPSAPSAAGGSLRPTPGRFRATNLPVRALIAYAFSLFDFQILDGPAWTDNERYDIEAAYTGGFRSDAQMVQALLRERFGLRTRTEMRPMPIYVLTYARDDRRLGPNLRSVTRECRPATGERPCRANFPPGRIVATGWEWEQIALARQLAGPLARTVVDRTDLRGQFDLTLEWTPDLNAAQANGGGVDVFTAIQEQLGLKLEPSRGPVDILVIERIERPSEN